MSTLSPKKTEIRNRENRILELARPMVAHGGLSGLSMDRIASEMRYAKGTIYNHFRCKEEILMALAIQAVETRLALFDAASTALRQSRQRMAAIGIANVFFRKNFGDLFRVDAMVRHESIWTKTSEKRRELLVSCEHRCMGLVAGIGRDAVASGDLNLEETHCVEELVFGLWSLSNGGLLIDLSSPGLDKIGVRDAEAAIHRNCNALLDGFGWKPRFNAEKFDALVTETNSILEATIVNESFALATGQMVADGPSKGRGG